MPWVEAVRPTRMERVAVVTPSAALRDVLAAVADAGVLEPEVLEHVGSRPVGALWDRVRSSTAGTPVTPVLASLRPDPEELVEAGRLGELAGESELERVMAGAARRGEVAAVLGWVPAADVAPLARRLAALGAGVTTLARPPGIDPPTLVPRAGASGAFQRLVDTYATVPYEDLNPSLGAGIAYVAMFGIMFGDVGHGLLLVALGLLLRAGRPHTLARLRWAAPFVIGAGLASVAFGFAYGEAFGPTGLVPVLWLAPVDHATTLLAVAIAVGAVLLAVAYALGAVNRWREGGPRRALVALSGVAGIGLYVGLSVAGAGWYLHRTGVAVVGAVLAVTGLALGFEGLYVGAGGRASGAVQAGVESFDAVVRLGTNTISFARLAAFGLTHAALGQLVWSGTADLWDRGALLWAPAAAVFVVGNAVAFGLEGLVAGVQALRLEYYELFSRIFVSEGRPFRPWHLSVVATKEASCSPG